MIIKAISVHQPEASKIKQGFKTIETRTWYTYHRGDLLICSTLQPEIPGFLCGYALCIVNLFNCRKMIRTDEFEAKCKWQPKLWAWVLNEVRPVFEPFRVRGRQGLFDVEIED